MLKSFLSSLLFFSIDINGSLGFSFLKKEKCPATLNVCQIKLINTPKNIRRRDGWKATSFQLAKAQQRIITSMIVLTSWNKSNENTNHKYDIRLFNVRHIPLTFYPFPSYFRHQTSSVPDACLACLGMT